MSTNSLSPFYKDALCAEVTISTISLINFLSNNLSISYSVSSPRRNCKLIADRIIVQHMCSIIPQISVTLQYVFHTEYTAFWEETRGILHNFT